MSNGGECRVDSPHFNEKTGKSYFPPMAATEEACGKHSNFEAWSKARQEEIRREELGGEFHDFDPTCGHNCICVRLGQHAGNPNRTKIELPGGRYLTVLTRCKICSGTGKVAESTVVGPIPRLPQRPRVASVVNDDGEMEMPQAEFTGEEILGDNGEPIGGETSFDALKDVDAKIAAAMNQRS